MILFKVQYHWKHNSGKKIVDTPTLSSLSSSVILPQLYSAEFTAEKYKFKELNFLLFFKNKLERAVNVFSIQMKSFNNTGKASQDAPNKVGWENFQIVQSFG